MEGLQHLAEEFVLNSVGNRKLMKSFSAEILSWLELKCFLGRLIWQWVGSVILGGYRKGWVLTSEEVIAAVQVRGEMAWWQRHCLPYPSCTLTSLAVTVPCMPTWWFLTTNSHISAWRSFLATGACWTFAQGRPKCQGVNNLQEQPSTKGWRKLLEK